MKIQNHNLKQQISNISARIEETIQSMKIIKESPQPVNNLYEDVNTFNEEYVPIQKKINKYKELITDLKNKMDGFYNLRK
jgi:hypothetical protein